MLPNEKNDLIESFGNWRFPNDFLIYDVVTGARASIEKIPLDMMRVSG